MMIKGLKFLLTAKAALAGIAFVWRMPFRRYSDWLHFFFYDVGLKALTAFCFGYFYLPNLYFTTFLACHPVTLSSVSLCYITSAITVFNHNSDDSISQLQTRSPKTIHPTLIDIYNHELYPQYWGTSPQDAPLVPSDSFVASLNTTLTLPHYSHHRYLDSPFCRLPRLPLQSHRLPPNSVQEIHGRSFRRLSRIHLQRQA